MRSLKADDNRPKSPTEETPGSKEVALPIDGSILEPPVVLSDVLPGPEPTFETMRRPDLPTERPFVDIVIPVYNEERVLAASVRSLRLYLDRSFPFSTVITIADNGSTDDTPSIAAELSAQCDGVRSIRLESKGRGRALRSAWAQSDAQVVAYMDVDLSSSLDALLPLVAPVISDRSVISIGSRLAHGANIVRSRKRDRISRAYNLLLRVLLRTEFSDAQCGFKAANADVARRLLPEIQDDDWFFDTELLFRAQRHGLRIIEVPVDWVEDPDSRVDILPTAVEDLRGIARLLRDKLARRGASMTPPAITSASVSSGREA